MFSLGKFSKTDKAVDISYFNESKRAMSLLSSNFFLLENWQAETAINEKAASSKKRMGNFFVS